MKMIKDNYLQYDPWIKFNNLLDYTTAKEILIRKMVKNEVCVFPQKSFPSPFQYFLKNFCTYISIFPILSLLGNFSI